MFAFRREPVYAQSDDELRKGAWKVKALRDETSGLRVGYHALSKTILADCITPVFPRLHERIPRLVPLVHGLARRQRRCHA